MPRGQRHEPPEWCLAAREQQPAPRQPQAPSNPPSGTIDANQVDSWLAVGQDGNVTIFSGRVELGTGTRTALAQIAADELYVPFERVSMVQGDTARTPDEGYTAGSKTIQVGGVNVRKAAAEARQALLEMASARLGVGQDSLTLDGGIISVGDDSSRRLTYGDLIGNQVFNRNISDQTPLKNPSLYTVVGQSIPRVDLPPKMFGQQSYVQDLRLPGMLHGRVIHPPSIGATVDSVDESSVSGIADLVRVVRNGNFVGVIAQSEWGAIQAARQLNVAWNNASVLPDQNQLGDWLRQQPTSDKQIVNNGDVDTALSNADQVIQASYNHPYQDHAQLLGMPADSVHVIHMECAFSGCARTSTSGSRTVRRWRSTCAARLTARAANNRVTVHWLSDSPIRVSALRSLGAMANTFANESFMDELAYAAGLDPLQFRLNHLDDPRAIAVLQAAADKIGWQAHTAPSGTGRGMGIAFARYENNEAYVATAADVSVDASSGRITLNRIAVAHDCGLIINPELPAYGAGEITTLTPPPAIANAIFHATGQRMRSVPLL